MQCRNYMQQYSRTKSIRQINKTRSSYKQLIQNSKTRDNSNAHNNLKLSGQKRCSEKLNNHPSVSTFGDLQYQNSYNVQPSKKDQVQPLLTNTQNINNISKLSYGKLNSKMKLKVNTDKSIRSMSSHQQLKQHNSFVASSMANIGVGLASQKKKPKIVTLTANSGNVHTTSKKQKSYNELKSVSRMEHDKSRSISKSHQNSAINSKYSTNMAHETVYQSVKKQTQNPNIQIITLNTSMVMGKDGENQDSNLEQIYGRVRNILNFNRQKQKQWELQRSYYQSKIKQLEKQLQDATRKGNSTKPTHSQIYTYSSINNNSHDETNQNYKSSNRKGNVNHR